MRVTEATPDEAAGMNRSESLSRAAQQAKNCPAIVAAKVHRVVEAFAAQCAEDWPRLFEPGVAAPAWQRPDTSEPRQMLEKGRDLLRHERVQRAAGPALANRAQRWNHEDSVAEIFELNRQDFQGQPACAGQRDCHKRFPIGPRW